eukprot:412206-Prymnesium_polylepis.1
MCTLLRASLSLGRLKAAQSTSVTGRAGQRSTTRGNPGQTFWTSCSSRIICGGQQGTDRADE